MGVLDAMVETAAYVMSRQDNPISVFLRATKANTDHKEAALVNALKTGANRFEQRTSRFQVIPNAPLAYWAEKKSFELFEQAPTFERSKTRGAKQGTATESNFRYIRNYWECKGNVNPSIDAKNDDWPYYLMSDVSSRYFLNLSTVINWKLNGYELKKVFDLKYGSYSKNIKSEAIYKKEGLSWSVRTARFEPHIIPKNCIPETAR